MDKQAINKDGEKTASHPCVNLVRQYDTNFEQSESYPIGTQTAVGQQAMSTQTPAQQPPQLPIQAVQFTTSGAHATEHSSNITNGNITTNSSTTSTTNAITAY